jgi:hypothetical protein
MKAKAKKFALVCLFAFAALVVLNLASPAEQSPAPAPQIAILP